MNQKESFNKIKELWEKTIIPNVNKLHNRDGEPIYEFEKELEKNGFSLTEKYHLHGIGNNNDRDIYIKDYDEDGFLVEKKIAHLKYTYGIYGGVYVGLKDLCSEEELKAGHCS